MRMIFKHFGIAACLLAGTLASAPVTAHPACSLDQGVSAPVDLLDTVLDTVSGAALKKGEFETTAEFEDRKSSASLASSGFVLDILIDQDHAIYDADRSTWTFHQFFLAGGNYNFDEQALDAAGLGDAGWSTSKILRATDADEGSYVASNAYGHQTTVRELLAKRVGIIEIARGHPTSLDYRVKYAPKFQMPLSLRIPMDGLPDGLETAAFEISMPVDQARQVKGLFRFVVAGELVEPLRIDYTRYISPNIDNPVEATVELT
jgi:hypothetical protein